VTGLRSDALNGWSRDAVQRLIDQLREMNQVLRLALREGSFGFLAILGHVDIGFMNILHDEEAAGWALQLRDWHAAGCGPEWPSVAARLLRRHEEYIEALQDRT
jgi:hypothetical protein